jgi:hypothetical protein
MLAFVLPSLLACQFTGRPGLSSIETYNTQIQDLQQRTWSIYNYMMLSIADWARTPDTSADLSILDQSSRAKQNGCIWIVGVKQTEETTVSINLWDAVHVVN